MIDPIIAVAVFVAIGWGSYFLFRKYQTKTPTAANPLPAEPAPAPVAPPAPPPAPPAPPAPPPTPPSS